MSRIGFEDVALTAEDHDHEKDIAFYSESVAAWYGTALELDRSLLTLSVAGLGLLLAILTAGKGPDSWWLAVVYVCAVVGLLITVVAVLVIFQLNKSLIEHTLFPSTDAAGTGRPRSPDQLLKWLDRAAYIAFAFGILGAAIIGTSLVVSSFEEKAMTNNGKGPVTRGLANDSFNGASRLSVSNESFSGAAKIKQPVTKSFTGAANLKPHSGTAGSATPVTSGTPAVPSGSTSTGSGSQGSGK